MENILENHFSVEKGTKFRASKIWESELYTQLTHRITWHYVCIMHSVVFGRVCNYLKTQLFVVGWSAAVELRDDDRYFFSIRRVLIP
jgi:hypothetical protein